MGKALAQRHLTQQQACQAGRALHVPCQRLDGTGSEASSRGGRRSHSLSERASLNRVAQGSA